MTPSGPRSSASAGWQGDSRTSPSPRAPSAASPVALAMDLLGRLAEDPLIRPSYRIAARRHLARLAPPPPRRPVAAEADDGDDG